MTRPWVAPALLLLAAATACSSQKSGAPAPVITKIDYDSTRDGPVMPKASDAAPAVPSKCAHVWEALPRSTHYYQDPSSDLSSMLLCTPVRCPKCGLVRHECQQRRRR